MGELEAIRIFLAVAEQRSFAGAARALGMTPASVTRSIAALEGRLGVQLLVRTTRQVSLTSAGAVYAERVAPLALGIADAANGAREAQGVTSGRLRISAPLSLGVKLLPDVLTQFATLHPRVHLALNLTDSFVDILEDDFDLAIRVSGPPTDKSTIWRKICPVPRVLIAAPGYLTARGTPERPEDLETLSLLSFGAGPGPEVWDLTDGTRRHAVTAEGGFSANNGDLLARLAVNGEGVALLPRFIVADDLSAGRLVEVLPHWRAPDIWLTLYYPPYEQLPLRVAAFSNVFEAWLRESRPL